MFSDMTTIMAMGPAWTDPIQLLSENGPFGAAVLPAMFIMVFIESGLLFPFLPGDSLLFTAGLLASQPDGFAPLWVVLVAAPIAAILGDQVGYWTAQTDGSSSSPTSSKPRISSTNTGPSRSSFVASCPSCAPMPRWSRVWRA